MKRLISPTLTLLLLTLATGQASADFALLLSSPDNLSDLKVGQQVTLQVSLSGASSANFLDSLTTDVAFPSGTFSISQISPGAIVPDTTGFQSGFNNSSGSGSYDDLFANSGSPITSNGAFFSIRATAAMAGTGTVTLANQIAFQGFNQITPSDDTPGGGLSFDISPSSAVPAPPGLVLASSGATLLLLVGSLRARRDVWIASLKRWAQCLSFARILAALAISPIK